MSYYRPLPDSLTIRGSEIEGVGLFAIKDIENGVNLGLTHLYDWSSEDCYVRTPLGGFINHSDNPNCKLQYEDEIESSPWETPSGKNTSNRYLVTLKHLKRGDELTAKYDVYDPTK